MSRKRALIPDLHKAYAKRRCQSGSSIEVNGDSISEVSKGPGVVPNNETRTGLLFLRGLFPVEKFDCRLPPIILQHQLYSLINDRTQVDKQVNDLHNSREIKIFKLGLDETNRSLVFSEDYHNHVIKVMTDMNVEHIIIEKVKKCILDQCTDVCLDKETLMKSCFTDTEITQLVKVSVLTIRDVGSYWLSIPNAGMFMKSFSRGRKALVTMIRKSKYREILREELEQRQWPKVARLGISYHIHDIIGADLVACITTTSGQLLRLKE